MLAAAAAMWRKASREPDVGASSPALCPPLRLSLDLLAGFGIGAMTGFFGVGGGFLIVPTLAIFLTLSMRLAVGTSLVIITGSSVMALSAHLVSGRGLDVPLTAAMTAGCVAGALIGARVAPRIPQTALGRVFAALVVVVSGYLLISAAFLGAPPGS